MKLPFKNYYNYTMGFVLIYSFLTIIISSYILWFILPMGQGMGGNKLCPTRLTGLGVQGNNTFVFDWPRYVWVDIHSWIALVAIGLVIIHLILHWRWIIETAKRIKVYFIKKQKAILERYIVVVVLFLMSLFETFSGWILWIIMPRGVGDQLLAKYDFGRVFWGLQRNEWVDLHAWVAVLLVMIIVVLIVMHWQWIVNMTMGKLKSNNIKRNAMPLNTYDENLLQTINDSDRPYYLVRIANFVGLGGCISFLVTMLTFQLDWLSRYDFLLYLIPVPLRLLVAKKWPYIGDTSYNLGVSAIFCI
jgi:hypothetical protein